MRGEEVSSFFLFAWESQSPARWELLLTESSHRDRQGEVRRQPDAASGRVKADE
jgi:hypothetical protein